MTSYSKYSYSQLEKMKASRIDSLIRSYHPNTNDLSETIKALNDYREVVDEIRRRELKVKDIEEVTDEHE